MISKVVSTSLIGYVQNMEFNKVLLTGKFSAEHCVKCMTMEWKKIQEEILYWDGSLRDIYFQGTNDNDWETFLEFIRNGDHKYEFLLNDRATKLFSYAAMKNHESKLLRIWVNDIILACHFFCDEEIELDIDLRDVKNFDKWNSLIDFLKNLAQNIGINGIITPENMDDLVLLNIDGST